MNGFGANHDGAEFAKKGIVTVTINYRLGRAGWFAHPALAKEGATAATSLDDFVKKLGYVHEWFRNSLTVFVPEIRHAAATPQV